MAGLFGRVHRFDRKAVSVGSDFSVEIEPRRFEAAVLPSREGPNALGFTRSWTARLDVIQSLPVRAGHVPEHAFVLLRRRMLR